MTRTQNCKRFVVLFFNRGQQVVSERLNFLAYLCRFHKQNLEAHERQRLIETTYDGRNVESCSRGPRKQRRIDRRLEERELPKDAANVEAVANLEETIGNRVPVAQQFVVTRYAEVERVADAEHCIELTVISLITRTIRDVVRNIAFKFDERIAESVEIVFEVCISLRAHFSLLRHCLRSW